MKHHRLPNEDTGNLVQRLHTIFRDGAQFSLATDPTNTLYTIIDAKYNAYNTALVLAGYVDAETGTSHSKSLENVNLDDIRIHTT